MSKKRVYKQHTQTFKEEGVILGLSKVTPLIFFIPLRIRLYCLA